MTDGNVIVFQTEPDFGILLEARFPEIGGIWSICGVNEDQDLAVGTLRGLHILNMGSRELVRTDELYLSGLNVWNVREYD